MSHFRRMENYGTIFVEDVSVVSEFHPIGWISEGTFAEIYREPGWQTSK